MRVTDKSHMEGAKQQDRTRPTHRACGQIAGCDWARGGHLPTQSKDEGRFKQAPPAATRPFRFRPCTGHRPPSPSNSC